MKKLKLLIAFVLLGFAAFAQQTLTIPYQALVRDANGNPVASRPVGAKITLLQGSVSGLMVYDETQTDTTNAFGQMDLLIGSQKPADFDTINWSSGKMFIKLEVDIAGGMNYLEINTHQLLATPYAKYAEKAGPSTFPPGMIMPFAGSVDKIPDGWLLCNGAEINRNQYDALFNTIGMAYGAGNLTTTFNLPDLRGMFLRGANQGRTDDYKDPDLNTRIPNALGNKDDAGSKQGDQFESHNHGGYTVMHQYDPLQAAWTTSGNWGNGHLNTIETNGGNETRPNNIYVNYIIKY